jgi:hypothetical protein
VLPPGCLLRDEGLLSLLGKAALCQGTGWAAAPAGSGPGSAPLISNPFALAPPLSSASFFQLRLTGLLAGSDAVSRATVAAAAAASAVVGSTGITPVLQAADSGFYAFSADYGGDVMDFLHSQQVREREQQQQSCSSVRPFVSYHIPLSTACRALPSPLSSSSFLCSLTQPSMCQQATWQSSSQTSMGA